MEKYIGLINPSKLKLEFLFDLFLIFSPDLKHNNLKYIHMEAQKKFISHLESMVMKRFDTLEEINLYIKEVLGYSPELQEQTRDEDILQLDNCLVSNCTDVKDEDYCYIDVYYLITNANQFFISEVGYDFST